MKISGFTFLRNGSKLYYPILESIQSALPLVDEFVIAFGDSDADDTAKQDIQALGSDKIVSFDTVWDVNRYPDGTEYAHQTDLAKDRCCGDWLLYLQGDEVLHEDDQAVIRASCERWLEDQRIEGMIFDYLHFWGDYQHVHRSHAWYKQEIRIIRNWPELHSRNDAQSFRRIPDFDGRDYRQKAGVHKLRCVHSGARIFHYGWVRPPRIMQQKQTHMGSWYQSKATSSINLRAPSGAFDYGPLEKVPRYCGAHPAVMTDRISKLDWKQDLYESSPSGKPVPDLKFLRWRCRFLSWLENAFFGGRLLFSSKHYCLYRGEPRKRD